MLVYPNPTLRVVALDRGGSLEADILLAYTAWEHVPSRGQTQVGLGSICWTRGAALAGPRSRLLPNLVEFAKLG